jgi:GntR family transcriptional regulator
MEIEFESTIPLYEQIVEQLQTLIKEGDLSPGDQLPTTRQLAVKLGINFNTVARAYRLLDQEGLISTQPGRGTFVLDQSKQKPKAKRTEDQIEELTRYYIRKATQLGFKEEEIKGCFEKMISGKKEN